MTISAADVKRLRLKTGVGLMDCKKALKESEGNIEAAEKFLREKGVISASKKADRSANEGKVFIALKQNRGVIVEINCETDFVSNNDAFQAFGDQVVNLLLAHPSISSAEDAKALSINGTTLSQLTSELVLKLGENIQLGQIKHLSATGALASYIHLNGKIGVLVTFSGAINDELSKDIAMHVAATSPQFLSRDDVPDSVKESEREIICNQLKNEGKPADLVEKIAMGKLNKFFKEICLLNQPFVKDDKKSIEQILPNSVKIESFARFSLV